MNQINGGGKESRPFHIKFTRAFTHKGPFLFDIMGYESENHPVHHIRLDSLLEGLGGRLGGCSHGTMKDK